MGELKQFEGVVASFTISHVPLQQHHIELGAAVLVGNGDHAELWSTDDWNASNDDMLSIGEDVLLLGEF